MRYISISHMQYIFGVAVVDTGGEILRTRFLHYNEPILTSFPSDWILEFEGRKIVAGDTPDSVGMPKNDVSYTVLVNPDAFKTDMNDVSDVETDGIE